MENRNSSNNVSLDQRNERRKENSWWGITCEGNRGACNPSFGTCSTNDIRSATDPYLKCSGRAHPFLERSGRDFSYGDTRRRYDNRSELGTHRSWVYEKRYEGRSHIVRDDYERRVDSWTDPSAGMSLSNIPMPRKNPPCMWDYNRGYEKRWNHGKWDNECQGYNTVNDPFMDRYSVNEVPTMTNPRQNWDYDRRYPQSWNERGCNYKQNVLPMKKRWKHAKWDNECQGYNTVNDPFMDRYSVNEVPPMTNPRQNWDYDRRYPQSWNERGWNYKQNVLPMKNSHGTKDHNFRYERKRNDRKWDYEHQVDNRGSILPMTNSTETLDPETRYERRKKQRMWGFESQVEDNCSVPSVGISAADVILPETNPSVNASVKMSTNFEPIVTQHVEVMEDNLMDKAPISSRVGEAPSSAEFVKHETGVMMKENTISQLGDSLEEAHLIVPRRKKLIILDVNGLLADFVPFFPIGYKHDTTISGKAVFKRPFCDDFLHFCFKHFEVGVWSSRVRKNLDLVIDFLMGDLRHKLLFCWDQSHCTETGFTTVENRSKPLVLKELRKIWEKLDPNLSCEKGEYNESNTVLLDDSPYKALRNPVNTSIFPRSYCYRDIGDTSLGPGGDLRVYIEGLAMAENVQNYIKQNPFGQSPITESNASWGFYSQIIHSGCVQKEKEENSVMALHALKSK